MTDIAVRGGASYEAVAINDRGAVVGWMWDPTDGSERSFVWQDGALTMLGSLGGNTAKGTAINSTGQVAGAGNVRPGGLTHPFIWRDGTMIDLGHAWTGATEINDRGQVLLSDADRGFVWQDGVVIDLGTLGGASAYATDINGCGVVVGMSDTDRRGVRHPFLTPTLGRMP